MTGIFLPSPRPALRHQEEAFERFKDSPIVPLFWEQRVRKTRVVLDIFRYRYHRGDVDALLIFANPNGVQHVWPEEIAKDFPAEDLAITKVLSWRTGKTTTGRRREEALALRDHDGMIVAAFYCGTLVTEKGWRYVSWLLNRRRAMVVADEASWAANWNARTRRLLALGGFYARRSKEFIPTSRQVIVKAILDGTPTAEGPDDVFYPTQFLRRGLLGFDSLTAFRARYHEYEEEITEELRDGQRVIVARPKVGYNRNNMVKQADGSFKPLEYKIFKGYRNLDELAAKLAMVGSRITRDQVSDAPRQTFQSRYFELTDRQRRVYDRARDDYVAELGSGERSLAEVLLRMTRLQMIARNFYPPERVGMTCAACEGIGFGATGECETCGGIGIVAGLTELERIDVRNPATEALTAELAVTRGPVVVWARFRQEVEDIVEAAATAGKRLLRYDGTLTADEREAAYQAFRAGEGDGIAGTILSGLSRGKDLTRAKTLIYYSNEFGLRAREQSQDRAESLTRGFSTDVIDLVAADTRDLDVIAALREKRLTSAKILRDRVTEWL